MHVWFLHKRLTSDGNDPHMAALIQEELFDILWTDTTCRMRSHGVNEWVIGKNLKTVSARDGGGNLIGEHLELNILKPNIQVQQYTFMHCFHYDHCYTELLDKPEQRFDELKDLVMAHILLLSPDDEKAHAVHNDQAERIAWYIEAQYQNIGHDLPEESYRNGRVAWVDLPDFSELKDGKGNILEDHPIDPDDVLPDAWVKNVANDGTYYYWNLKTREATWDRPIGNA
jgi:cytochrome b pre-mRNA-processing protein 3